MPTHTTISGTTATTVTAQPAPPGTQAVRAAAVLKEQRQQLLVGACQGHSRAVRGRRGLAPGPTTTTGGRTRGPAAPAGEGLTG